MPSVAGTTMQNLLLVYLAAAELDCESNDRAVLGKASLTPAPHRAPLIRNNEKQYLGSAVAVLVYFSHVLLCDVVQEVFAMLGASF